MQVSIKGLINRLDSLRERINDLFDNLDSSEELEQEDIEVETVRQYFQNDDTFNLSIALDVLEQADELDKALEIIKEKNVNCDLVKQTKNVHEYNKSLGGLGVAGARHFNLIQEEFDLLKEVLL